jgi:ribosomal protein L11 methyltransferase
MKNAELNQVKAKVQEGRAGDYLSHPAEVVLANIHWEIQKDLWQDKTCLKGKKDLILSGVTRSQIGKLKDLVTARGYRIEQEKQAEDTWFTIWCRA